MDSFSRLVTGILAVAVASAGCGDDGAAPVDETTAGPTATDSASTSAATDPSATTGPTATTGATTSGTDSGTDGDTSGGPGETTRADSSTGDPLLCGITDNPDERGPWFALENYRNPVESGAVIALECGGQGSLMFYLRSDQGGFLPEGETVYYAVTVDVEGFDDLSPNGHFFQDLSYGVDVGCAAADENEGGFSLDGIAVVPPDALTDVSMIDGLPATVHVELLPPGADPVVLDAEVTIMVDEALSIENCSFG